jgi:hypothetical protein
MANFITFPVIGTATFGSASALTIGANALLDATTIARVEALSATTTAIHFASPFATTQKLILTHTSTPILVNPLTGVNQWPVKDGIEAALTGVPSTPTVAVQVPTYVTGTAAAPVYTNVQITSGVWS